jgi:hypothetical protein
VSCYSHGKSDIRVLENCSSGKNSPTINILSRKGGNIMHSNQMIPEPMTEYQLEYNIRKEIKKTYLFLIGHTAHDPQVIELMKLSALADVQKRYEAGEPW